MTTLRTRLLGSLPVDLGRYRLLGVLGRGGMGVVYRAELRGPAGFRKPVAVKILVPSRDANVPVLTQRFEQEARLGGLLRHPCVVDVYDFGVTDGCPWIAMELVDGWTLGELLRSLGPLPAQAGLEVAVAVAEGLVHAHSLQVGGADAGLVHRDLKPGNVLVGRDGRVRLLDFGIASVEALGRVDGEPGVVCGTPAYMAPEQLADKDVDARADLYGLGAVLFELFTGRRMMDAQDMPSIAFKLAALDDWSGGCGEELDRIAPGLGAVFVRCVRRRPADRYASAADLHADLLRVTATAPPSRSLRGWVESAPTAQPLALEPPSEEITLSAASLAASALQPLASPPPRESGVFIGRAPELDALAAAVGAGHRLVTVAGPVGVGKSRLAVRTARAAGIPCAWCELVGLQELELATRAVARALDVPLDRPGTIDDQIVLLGHALEARGRLLLLVDNADGVASEAERLLGPLLRLAPEATLLVTSRQHLRLPAEHVVTVGPLAPAEAETLFSVRVAEARGRPVESGESNDARAISAALDGLPLALELAAARAPVVSLPQLRRRLDSRGHDASGLAAALDDSWALLRPWERAALLQCSVFRGGFTLDSAEQVVDLSAWPRSPWTMDVVQGLWERSLVRLVREAGPEGVARFGFLETIRSWAEDKLHASPRMHEVFGRHASWVLAQAEDAVGRLHGPGWRAARDAIDGWRPDLRAVFERGLQRDLESAARAALVLTAVPGPVAEHAELLDGVPGADLPLRMLAALAVRRSRIREREGRLEDALAEAERARILADEAGGSVGRVVALARLAAAFGANDRLAEALEVGLEAQALAAVAGDRLSRALALEAVGGALGRAGRCHDAVASLEEAYRLREELGDEPMLAPLRGSIALNHGNAGRIEVAEEQLGLALAAYRAIGDRRGEARTSGSLALVELQRGRPAAARRRFERAMRHGRELGDRRSEVVLLPNLGFCVLLDEGAAAADALLRRRLDVDGDALSPTLRALAVRAWSSALNALGRYREAEEILRPALDGLEERAMARVPASLRLSLAVALAGQGRVEAAQAEVAAVETTAASRTASGRALLNLVRAHLPMAQAMTASELDAACSAAELVHGLWGHPVRTESDLHPAINRVERAVLEAATLRRRAEIRIRA